MYSEAEIGNLPVAILGIPFDSNSSFLRGPAEAPDRIRHALTSPSANLSTESGLDLDVSSSWRDAGDLVFDDSQNPLDTIESAVDRLLGGGERILSLGGDHSIAWPILRAHSRHFDNITILQFDAHPDLYDEFNGKRDSHACPFARIMEEELAVRLVQVGVRTMTMHQRRQAERFHVDTVEARRFSPDALPDFKGPVYVSLDLDVLDPAFAPGVSHHEPGGLSTREVLGMIQHLGAPLVGADIVEYNPRRDPDGLTAMVAAKCLKELLSRMLV